MYVGTHMGLISVRGVWIYSFHTDYTKVSNHGAMIYNVRTPDGMKLHTDRTSLNKYSLERPGTAEEGWWSMAETRIEKIVGMNLDQGDPCSPHLVVHSHIEVNSTALS